MRHRTIARRLVAALWTSMAATCLHAAGLQVAPTGIALAPRQTADGLWLSNSSTETLHAQVRAYRWLQVGDEDRLEPTRDLIVSPPALRLPPGQRQLVRVIRAGPPPADGETSYRVIVDELPVAAGDDAQAGRGLRFVLRYSLPVFLLPAVEVEAPGGAGPRLEARLIEDAGRPRLRIANAGDRHAQLADLHFLDAAGRRHVMGEGLAGYVLPGQQRTWPLPATLPATPQAGGLPAGTFKVRINGELVERTLQPASATATPR